MKKLISLAAAASLTFATLPALAKDASDVLPKSTIRVERKVAKIRRQAEQKIQKAYDRVSRRTIKRNALKKITPSEACKNTAGTERALCMRAFNKGKKMSSSSSSSLSSSSSSSMSSSSMPSSQSMSSASSSN